MRERVSNFAPEHRVADRGLPRVSVLVPVELKAQGSVPAPAEAKASVWVVEVKVAASRRVAAGRGPKVVVADLISVQRVTADPRAIAIASPEINARTTGTIIAINSITGRVTTTTAIGAVEGTGTGATTIGGVRPRGLA